MDRAGDILRRMMQGRGNKTDAEILREAQAILDQKRVESKQLDPPKKPKLKRSPAIDPKTGTVTVIEEPFSPTPRQIELAETSADIRMRQPLPAELAFLARHLVQVTLPHSDPGNVAKWERTNGHLTLRMASTDGYPYGAIPRLIFYWMTTEAKRTNQRKLYLGNTLAQFMREVGISNTGRGKRSNAYRLRDQVHRLFSTMITFLSNDQIDSLERERRVNMLIADESELWWDTRHVDQGNLWNSYVVLNGRFFEALTASVVPVDTRALRALKKSPLALDVYGWATYRAHCVRAKGQPEFITYNQLMQQFGSDYSDPKNFRKYFLIALKQVCAVYPKLQIKVVKTGIEISNHSRTSVPPSGVTSQLPSSR